MTISSLPKATQGWYGHIIPLTPMAMNIMASHLLHAEYCSTVAHTAQCTASRHLHVTQTQALIEWYLASHSQSTALYRHFDEATSRLSIVLNLLKLLDCYWQWDVTVDTTMQSVQPKRASHHPCIRSNLFLCKFVYCYSCYGTLVAFTGHDQSDGIYNS